MNDNQVLDVDSQSSVENSVSNAFEAAAALLKKGDKFCLKLNSGDITVERELSEKKIDPALGFAESYYGQEGQNKFVTHCGNIAAKMGLTAKQTSNDGHFLTLELT